MDENPMLLHWLRNHPRKHRQHRFVQPARPTITTIVFNWSTEMNKFTCHAELVPVVDGDPKVTRRTCTVKVGDGPVQDLGVALDTVSTPQFVGNEGDTVVVTVTDFTVLNIASEPAVLSTVLSVDHTPPATPGLPKLVVDTVEPVADVAPAVEPTPAPEVVPPPAEVTPPADVIPDAPPTSNP